MSSYKLIYYSTSLSIQLNRFNRPLPHPSSTSGLRRTGSNCKIRAAGGGGSSPWWVVVVVVLPKREKTYYSYVENLRRDCFFVRRQIGVKLLIEAPHAYSYAFLDKRSKRNMRTNSSHSSIMRAIIYLLWEFGNSYTSIRELHTNSHLSYENLDVSFLGNFL